MTFYKLGLIPDHVWVSAWVLTQKHQKRLKYQCALTDDHSSPVLEWRMRAEAEGFTVDTVRRPNDGDWTSAALAAIERPGAPPVGLASISSVHWSDGGLIDVDAVAAVLKRQGAVFLIDATQSAGVLAMDVSRLDPDFVIFPTYKWLLGPYGRAFMYLAKRHQGGVPLEQTAAGRRNVRAENEVYFTDLRFVADARRFDMGERDHLISMEMASIGMEMVAEWGAPAIAQRLLMLTERIAEGLRGAGIGVPEPRFRAPHILSLGFKHGIPGSLVEALATEDIYVASRLGRGVEAGPLAADLFASVEADPLASIVDRGLELDGRSRPAPRE